MIWGVLAASIAGSASLAVVIWCIWKSFEGKLEVDRLLDEFDREFDQWERDEAKLDPVDGKWRAKP